MLLLPILTASISVLIYSFAMYLMYKCSAERIVDFLDAACKDRIEPFIDRSYKELADYVGAYEQKMFMKRENIANKGIWTAKKRYILNVWDSEGVRYEKPKLKIMGLEAVKSSTPAACRTAIKECMKVIMNKEEEEHKNLLQVSGRVFINCRSKIFHSREDAME